MQILSVVAIRGFIHVSKMGDSYLKLAAKYEPVAAHKNTLGNLPFLFNQVSF